MTWEIIRRGDMRAPAAALSRPTSWSPGALKAAFLEAGDIDRRMTPIKMPKAPGNYHPAVSHTHEDKDDWEAHDIDVDSFKPTPAERAKAEKVFGWLRLFTARELDLLDALRVWVHQKTRRMAAASKAESAANKALDILTGRLNEAAVPVF
jgi:hypothetical protein